MTTATATTDSELVLVDSSGWLEYLTADENADAFGQYLEDTDKQVIVPTIVVYEVVKILLLRSGKAEADHFLAEALRRHIVDLTETIALAAASLSIAHRLPMADVIIYATARQHNARIVTSDAHFGALPGVTLI